MQKRAVDKSKDFSVSFHTLWNNEKDDTLLDI